MHRALWFLFRLRVVGWFRRMGRVFQTTRGAILSIVSLMLFGTWLVSVCAGALTTSGEPFGPSVFEYIDRFAPFVLLAYCALVVSTSGGEAMPISFSPQEVQFLFSGPFSRRQLLTYKLVNQFLLAMPITLFATFGLRKVTNSIPQAFVAAVLTFGFMQLFALAVNFGAAVVGEFAYSRTRRIVLLAIVVALVLVAGQVLRPTPTAGTTLEKLHQIEQMSIVQWLVTPFRWFVHLATARAIWPDFAKWAGVCVLVNAVLVAAVYLMDVRYLEAAAAASERRYARLQRLRSGGLTGGGMVRSGKVKFSLPMLPWLGGAGPIAWRQFTGAIRGVRSLTILLIIIAVSAIGPGIANSMDEKAGEGLPWVLSGMALFMSMLMGQFFAYDFRPDIDRVEVLKSLPIKPWRVAVGQLIAPVLFASGFQILVVGLIYAVLGQIGYLLLAVVLLAVPVNLLLVGLDNWLFLLFPTRMMQATPGDLSQAGRHMLTMLAKMLALAVGLGIPAIFGTIAFAATSSWVAVTFVVWPVIAALALIPIPLVATAYRNFDVSRDTPP